MALVRATQQPGKFSSLARSLSKVLDTVTEIKQQRGNQAMNAAVLQAVGGLPEGASSSTRMGAASDATRDVRAGQGSAGFLGNIMSMFNPNVPTYGASTPIEEMLAQGAVNDMTARADYYRQAQEQSEKDLRTRYAQAEKSYFLWDKREQEYRAVQASIPADPEDGVIAGYKKQRDWYLREMENLRSQLSGGATPLRPGESPNARTIDAEIGAAPGIIGPPVSLMTPGQSPPGLVGPPIELMTPGQPPSTVAPGQVVPPSNVPDASLSFGGGIGGVGALGGVVQRDTKQIPTGKDGQMRQFIQSLPPEKQAEIMRVPPEYFKNLSKKSSKMIIDALRAGRGAFYLKNNEWFFDDEMQWQ